MALIANASSSVGVCSCFEAVRFAFTRNKRGCLAMTLLGAQEICVVEGGFFFEYNRTYSSAVFSFLSNSSSTAGFQYNEFKVARMASRLKVLTQKMGE